MTNKTPHSFSKPDQYSGRILSGPYSDKLKKDLVSSIAHFRALEEEVEGVVVKRFIPRSDAEVEALVVLRGSVEIKLPRGEKVPDPESRAELINILDRSTKLAIMGHSLSLNSDEYKVLGVYRDRITIRHQKTGKVFDVVGFADGE